VVFLKIQIDGLDCNIDEANAIIARNSVNSFLDVIRRGAIQKHNEALYLTTLITMYKKSFELLNELGAENVKYILDEHYSTTAAFDTH